MPAGPLPSRLQTTRDTFVSAGSSICAQPLPGSFEIQLRQWPCRPSLRCSILCSGWGGEGVAGGVGDPHAVLLADEVEAGVGDRLEGDPALALGERLDHEEGSVTAVALVGEPAGVDPAIGVAEVVAGTVDGLEGDTPGV